MSQISAASLLSMLDRVVPGFRAHAEAEDNPFDRESVGGVFAACSAFVRDRAVGEIAWSAVAELIHRIVGGPDADLDSAACTCFLENLASRDHALDPLLRGQALAHWRRWCDGG